MEQNEMVMGLDIVLDLDGEMGRCWAESLKINKDMR